jgi:hypothetical protein
MARHAAASGDRINLGNPSELQITGNITVCCWARWTTSTVNDPLLAKWGTGSAYTLIVGVTAGTADKAAFYIRVSATNKNANSTVARNDGNWWFIAGVFDGSNVLLRILDDTGAIVEQVTGSSTSGPIDNQADVSIFSYSTTPSSSGFLGDIANMAVYSEAKDNDELISIAKRGPLASPANLKGWWPLGLGSPEPDYSGYDNAGTVVEADSLSIVDNPPVAPLFGFDVPYVPVTSLVPVNVPVGKADLTITGQAPVASLGPFSVPVGKADLSVAGQTPVAVATEHVWVDTPKADLSIAGQTPSAVLGPFSVSVGKADITLTGQAPTVSLGPFSISVGKADITVTGYAPNAILGPFSVSIGKADLTMTGYAPTPTLGPFSVPVGKADLTVTGQAPVASLGPFAVPVGKADLTMTGQVPTVGISIVIPVPLALIVSATYPLQCSDPLLSRLARPT